MTDEWDEWTTRLADLMTDLMNLIDPSGGWYVDEEGVITRKKNPEILKRKEEDEN